MSDWFYNVVYNVCRWPLCFTMKPTVIGLAHTEHDGPYILAANHTSPYDIALLIYYIRRHLDFVSSKEVFDMPVVGRFYGAMNAFPLDRSKADSATVRIILQRLAAGRSIAMFPEGGFRLQDRSVLHGGAIRPGIGRIARLAQVPVIPCAIEDSLVYNKPTSFLPLRHCRVGVSFGPPIPPPSEDAGEDDAKQFESGLADQIRSLHKTLLEKMGRPAQEAATLRQKPRRS